MTTFQLSQMLLIDLKVCTNKSWLYKWILDTLHTPQKDKTMYAKHLT